ncbi:ABC transporter ATP-binding protein/permease [Sphingomonas sp. 22176]|uniref:ABC transporter ATP-binding protein/permease n=1 Tax=Sphingomonas sp. 22176 TaxID=3453884 RepID=UPI003F829433
MKAKTEREKTGTVRSRIVIAARDKRIDGRFFRRLWALAAPYWLSRDARLSWLLFAVMIGQSTASGLIGGMQTLVTQQQTNALVAKQVASFWPLTYWLVGLMIGSAMVGWVSGAGRDLIEIRWRRWLTERLTDRYLNDRTYYDIAVDNDIDNPDQRIQEEVGPLVKALIALPQTVVNIVFSISIQTVILSRISPDMTKAVFAFVILRAISMIYIYRPGIGIAWDIKIAEADLRYGILHVRDNAETIAFYRGESAERTQIQARLRHALRQATRQVLNNVYVNACLQALQIGQFFLPLLFVVPLFFAGRIEYGAIAAAAMAARLIEDSLSQVSNIIPTLTAIAPNVVRLAQIVEKSDEIRGRTRTHADKPGQHSIDMRRHDDMIRLSGVTYQTPGGERSLARDISLELRHGQRMIVVGQTGVGKSSLLRVLAGLWTRGEGRVDAPPLERSLFMPQKPYMLLGSLRVQLLYPGYSSPDVDDAFLLDALRRVQLRDLADRHGGLDVERDWGRILSLGEQQRIGFARFLVNRPDHVFLDEATSAVDLEMEKHLYQLLTEAGVTVVSVAHRASIIPFHDFILDLRADGWSLNPVSSKMVAGDDNPTIPPDRSSLPELLK